MLRLDVEVSWDILHLLTDDWKKTNAVHYELRHKYGTEVSLRYMNTIVTRLAKAGLIEAKKGTGIRRSFLDIITLRQVMKANRYRPRITASRGPGGLFCRRLHDLLDRQEFINNKILRERFKDA